RKRRREGRARWGKRAWGPLKPCRCALVSVHEKHEKTRKSQFSFRVFRVFRGQKFQGSKRLPSSCNSPARAPVGSGAMYSKALFVFVPTKTLSRAQIARGSRGYSGRG